MICVWVRECTQNSGSQQICLDFYFLLAKGLKGQSDMNNSLGDFLLFLVYECSPAGVHSLSDQQETSTFSNPHWAVLFPRSSFFTFGWPLACPNVTTASEAASPINTAAGD